MNQPRIEFIPLRPAIRSDAPTTLDLLIKITAPAPDAGVQRPALNLGLVLDRSGSMGGHNKIGFAREAAIFTVQELLPTDRVSLTIFDNHVETLAPNALVEDKNWLVNLIRGIESRGSTALHAGWEEGARQVGQHVVPRGLNRVLLLSDGQANSGVTQPDAIATDVHRLALGGIGTTTLGLGDDYNEDLLQSMANAGDGNYYYVEAPSQLPTIFATELRGLAATAGTGVTLAIEPGDGISVAEVLNDFERLPNSRLKLPNLVAGSPTLIVVRLQLPPMSPEKALCRFRLEWTAPRASERQTLTSSLNLPVATSSAWESLAANIDVHEQVVLLRIARLKERATIALQHGDAKEASRLIAEAREILATAPWTAEVQREDAAIARLKEYLDDESWSKFHKSSKYGSYTRRHSKTI